MAPDNDYALRPSFESPLPNELTDFIGRLIAIRRDSDALCYGGYENVVITNQQLIFERKTEKERILVAINASDSLFSANNQGLQGTYIDLITKKEGTMSSQLDMPPYSVQFLSIS